VSQRAIGVHVPTVSAGVASAMSEGADVIVVGTVNSPEAASAVVDAVAAGHLVLASISTPTGQEAAERLIERLSLDRRDLGRAALEAGLLGTITPVVKGAGRSFEVHARRDG
jgi:twitching motility protein PilT